MVIIKSINGYLYGGYAAVSWSSDEIGSYVEDPSGKSFVFSLTNPNNEPRKYSLVNSKQALYTYPMPVFGGKCSIYRL